MDATTAKAVTAPDPKVWLDRHGVTAYISADLEPLLAELWSEASLVGQVAAEAVTEGEAADWGDWQPGQPDKARTRLGGWVRGIARKVKDRVKGIARTRVDDLARALGRARTDGFTADELDAELQEILADAAARIAITEVTAASSDAAAATYEEQGVTQVRWGTEQDANVCGVCLGNEEDGARDMGEEFSSGDLRPPAHPHCRCSLRPAE